MLDVIFENIPTGLVQKTEQGVESSDFGELHDVIVLCRFLQALQNKAIGLQEVFEAVRKHFLRVLSSDGSLPSRCAVLVQIFECLCAKRLDIVGYHHGSSDSVFIEPNHTATTDRGQGSVLESFDFEHNTDIRGQVQTLSIGEGQEFVVVKDTVQIFNPFGVDIAVEHDPVPFRILTTEIVHNLSQNTGKQTVSPFSSGAVKISIECFFRHNLGVNDVGDTFNTFNALQRLQEDLPRRRFTSSRLANHHNTMVDTLDLVELKCLRDPHLTIHIMLFLSNLTNGSCKLIKVRWHIFHTLEILHLNIQHYINVFSD